MTRFEPHHLLAAGLALGMLGCGDDDQHPASDAGARDSGPGAADAAGDDGLAPPPAGQGIQLRLTHPIEAGQEIHICQYFVLPAEGLEVGRFEHGYRAGHHILLYPTRRTAADVAGELAPFECPGGAPAGMIAGFTYVDQVASGEVRYPPGVAWPYAPSEVVLLEAHAVNSTDQPAVTDHRLNLWRTETPMTQAAGALFFYDNHILVPANGQFTARMDCAVPREITVLAVAPHMHVRGRGYRAELEAPGGAITTLFDLEAWTPAEPVQHDPPLVVPAGARFRYECDYVNDGADAVMEGPFKYDNEMCMLLGSYYPRIDPDFDFCAAPGSGARFDGGKSCGETLACMTAAADALLAEACIVDTCAASSVAFGDLNSCVFGACIAQGVCSGPDCQACALERCAEPVAACQAAGCD